MKLAVEYFTFILFSNQIGQIKLAGRDIVLVYPLALILIILFVTPDRMCFCPLFTVSQLF